jgi:hypothetical protein
VTLIANYIPLEEPGEGPNYYRFSDSALYEIMVDVNGDAREDVTYQLDFDTKIGAVTPNTFLYNTGAIGQPPNPSNPTSQYTNLNQPQSYDLTFVRGNHHFSPWRAKLLNDARVAPIRVGPSSTGNEANYAALANAAVHTVGSSPKDTRVFVGPRDEGFYVDLMGNFDLLNLRNPGVDTTSGFNVYTIAIEVPKSVFANAGDTDGKIGVWATASRRQVRVLQDDGDRPNDFSKYVQVSRLGNPLVNEVLIPLKAKDKFNASEPKNDAANFANFVVNPGNSQGPAALIPLLNGVTGCTPTNGRVDLDLALLKGIPAGTLGLPGTQDTQRPGGPVQSDMLRLNYNVAPAASPDPLGAFGGDVAGFPNGRRPGDDVLDIAARAAGGGILHLLNAIDCPVSLTLSDNVQSNDVSYLSQFPYLGLPHEGYNHDHDHSGIDGMAVASMGFGVMGLALGAALVAPKALRRFRRPSR